MIYFNFKLACTYSYTKKTIGILIYRNLLDIYLNQNFKFKFEIVLILLLIYIIHIYIYCGIHRFLLPTLPPVLQKMATVCL